MSPIGRFARGWRLPLLCGIVLAAAAHEAQALRIVDYNLTNYPGNNSGLRNPKFRTVMAPLNADIVVSQELTSQTGVDSFRTRVLNLLEPGQWQSAPFINGNDTDNELFYKPSKVQFLGGWAWYPNPATNLRLVNVYRLKPVGYTSQAAELRIYSCHLKASSGFESDRLAEAIGIRDTMNALPPGTHAILMGDFNIYASTEPAFGKFLESQADNDGRLYDPLNAVGTWNNASFASIHTQCPCLTCPTGFGFAGGGLDDRFDMFLPTYAMNNGEGLDLLVSTYKPVGNDALHYNKDINAAPVIPEGQTYADALWYASDHLPVRIDVQLPAQIGVPGSLAFGIVIVGATATQQLSVSNTAVVPADELNYSFTADASFSAPGGSYVLNAGSPPAQSTITMLTATSGGKNGQLHVASDDPDHATTNVGLSGTVLDHAVASLDSLTQILADSLDFGNHTVGAFSDQTTRVFDAGYDSFQARLALASAVVTGGGGRFTIVSGSTPVLVAGPGQPFTLHFDDTSATLDSTYYATLTFTSGDEALPGAQAQPNLAVSLRARVLKPVDSEALPRITATRLYRPFPNPPRDGTTLRFDLAQSSPVRLEAFDVAGRRVAVLADRRFAPGAYQVRWDGRGTAGQSLGGGVYFIRMSGAGLRTQTVRLTMIR